MKKLVQLAIIASLGLLFSGCTLNQSGQTAVFPPTLSPAPIQPTAPQLTAIPATTNTPPESFPTQTALAATSTPLPPGQDTRIEFPPGATYTHVSGTIPAGGSLNFLVLANQDQLMMLDVGSPGQDVFLAVSGVSDGSVLVSGDARLTTWQGTLPATQDYRITLLTGGGESHYDLNLTIPAVIHFAPGATSTAIQGNLAANEDMHYMLYALAGQKMTVQVKSADGSALLTLYGITDGQPLVRSASGGTQWSGVLTTTQYYMIVVVSSGSPSQYLLLITIQ